MLAPRAILKRKERKKMMNKTRSVNCLVGKQNECRDEMQEEDDEEGERKTS